jgi:hypothetical protein
LEAVEVEIKRLKLELAQARNESTNAQGSHLSSFD